MWQGIVTSEGSPAFADRVAVADDLHVARMRAAGAIFIGKTNAPEFGLGSHTFNPVFGATRNPYDRAVTCGGSSGGAAVALATRMTAIADGSDMMGSLRNPAGWNNVYGFRPTWGRVPSEPAGDGYLHQISTNGPMARSPADIALLLNVMAGPDGRQPLGLKADQFSAEDVDIRGKRIGWLGDWGGAWAMEAGILDLCETAGGRLRRGRVRGRSHPRAVFPRCSLGKLDRVAQLGGFRWTCAPDGAPGCQGAAQGHGHLGGRTRHGAERGGSAGRQRNPL